MRQPWLIAASTIVAGALVRIAGATVLYSETLAEKVASSGTVVVAKVVRIEGQPPFDNAHRPTLVFRVTRSWRGAKVGATIHVPDWSDSPPFAYFGDGLPPRPEQIENARRQWQQTAVTPPAPGTPVLLLLAAPDNPQPTPADIPFPNHVVEPDASTLERVAGFVRKP